MTNRESRLYLMKAYKDLVLPYFNQNVYTSEEEFRALRWVMKKESNLRGFSMEVNSYSVPCRQSGPLLVELMNNGDLDVARYYLARAKLEGLDEQHSVGTALTWASYRGYLGQSEQIRRR